MARQDVVTTKTVSFEEGVYDGEVVDLQLPSNDRRLFDTDWQRERDRKLVDDLARRLAEELADQVFDVLLGQAS